MKKIDETSYLSKSEENRKRINSALKGGKATTYKNLKHLKQAYKIKKKLKKIKHKLTFSEWAESDYTFLSALFIVILMIIVWFL